MLTKDQIAEGGNAYFYNGRFAERVNICVDQTDVEEGCVRTGTTKDFKNGTDKIFTAGALHKDETGAQPKGQSGVWSLPIF